MNWVYIHRHATFPRRIVIKVWEAIYKRSGLARELTRERQESFGRTVDGGGGERATPERVAAEKKPKNTSLKEQKTQASRNGRGLALTQGSGARFRDIFNQQSV